MNHSRPYSAAFVAHHDAPLIAERAVRRGRIAMESGDEHAGCRVAVRLRSSLLNRIGTAGQGCDGHTGLKSLLTVGGQRGSAWARHGLILRF